MERGNHWSGRDHRHGDGTALVATGLSTSQRMIMNTESRLWERGPKHKLIRFEINQLELG